MDTLLSDVCLSSTTAVKSAVWTQCIALMPLFMACSLDFRVRLTVGNRTYRPGPVTVPADYQPLGLKNFEFEFQKLKIVGKSLKILRDLLSVMVSNLLQT
jgi:hypothetical protein